MSTLYERFFNIKPRGDLYSVSFSIHQANLIISENSVHMNNKSTPQILTLSESQFVVERRRQVLTGAGKLLGVSQCTTAERAHPIPLSVSNNFPEVDLLFYIS